jgi:hypothetical protein
VHHDADRNAVCVFHGYLSNLDELQERYGSSPTRGTLWGSPTAVAPGLKEDNDGYELRETAAEQVYRLYCRGEDPLVLLSELQGQFAFVLFDGRQVFAARDSSGKERLFYEITDDGAVSLSNSKLKVQSPEGIGFVEWTELPPGHFIAGKSPRVQQFALTLDELSAREIKDAEADELSPLPTPIASSRRSLSIEFADLGIE